MGGRWSRVWHGVLAVVVLASLGTQVVLSAAEPDPGTQLLRLVSYFTIQSNILVLITAVTLALDPATDGPVWRALRLDALLGITVTGIVFALVLADDQSLTGVRWWTNVGFHYVAPPATLLGWLLFGPRPRITWHTVRAAVLWPVAWLAWTYAHGAVTGWYPYPFLDVTELGYAIALLDTAMVILLAVALATVFKLLDARLPAGPRVGPAGEASEIGEAA